MCDHEEEYQEFPPVTFGGITGDYFLISPVTSCRWAEYRVIQLSTGDGAGQYSVAVSGNTDKLTNVFSYTNDKSYNSDNIVAALVYRMAATSTLRGASDWYRITNSEKKLFAHIYTLPANQVMYITVQFRVRLITKIPGPATTVHPDHAHALNIARSDAIKARLHIDDEVQEGEGLNARRN